MTRHHALRSARRLVLHSRTQMAFKGALAAALSWVAAEILTRSLGGLPLEQYVYYAPLGAVVATYPTVAASLRTARSSAAALALGAALGLLVHAMLDTGPLSLALVVGVGVALGALPGLGTQRSWVPIVALFVLIIGGDHAFTYALAYVALTALGALCGVAVNLLLPALRLTQGEEAINALRRLLAEQLRDLAGGLRSDPPPGREDWERRLHDPRPEVDRTREAVQEVMDAQLGNPRARHHVRDAERQRRLARALQRVAVFVEDLPEMLMQTYREDLDWRPLDRELAAVTAGALDNLADLIEAYDTDLRIDDPRVEAAEEAVRQVTYAFGQRRDLDDGHVAVLGAVVANLKRSTEAVEPEPPDEAAEEAPTRHEAPG